MVDTGATHSLITRSLLDTFPNIQIDPTSTTTALLGDASTAIVVHGTARLCVYINHIPTFVSVFVVDSLSIDFILGMDWCRAYDVVLHVRQQHLSLQHPHYGVTRVSFHETASVPVRLAQSIQLAPHHDHIVRLFVPVSSASDVIYTPDFNLCKTKHVSIPDALLSIKSFHSCIVISNSSKTHRTLSRHTIIGHISFSSTSFSHHTLSSLASSTNPSFSSSSSSSSPVSLSSIMPTSIP